MWILLVGIALGVVVTGLLKAWSRFESESVAGLDSEVARLRHTVADLTSRIENLEAIAAEESQSEASMNFSDEEVEDPALGRRGRVPLS